MINTKEIIKLSCSKKYRPLNAHQLAEYFNIAEPEFLQFCALLKELELKGEIVQVKKRQYANPGKVNLLVGTLECNQRGFGFVIPVNEDISGDIYVGEDNMGSALHGDIVVVRLPFQTRTRKRKRQRSGKNDSGKVVNVIHRENETVVGTLKTSKHFDYVAPDNPVLSRNIYISKEDTKNANYGDKVIVKIDQWPTRHLNAEGTIVEVLGKSGDPIVDVRSIVHQFKLPFKFEKNVLIEAEALYQPVNPEKANTRLDLRNEFIITIDPDDAKDFDDAISLKKDKDGNWLLGIYIADVTYYVKQDSELDTEARKRSTSVYLPGTVIPMLPEVLSNGICSLKEGEDRLTKGVLVTYSPDGKLLHSEIKHTIINVKKRLNYNNATKTLEESDKKEPDPVVETLLEMSKLAKLLYKKRMEDGAIELNLPEINIKIDKDGNISRIEKARRDVSHMIIEEFMITANRIVAEFMHKNHIPTVYRLHPEPDKDEMSDFAEFIYNCKNQRINPFDKKQLQALLKEIDDQPESYMINLMLLKSLRKAEYSVDQSFHFALGLEHYTHFTSPIRRYPDLIVHRLLDLFLADRLKSNKVKMHWKEKITGWASHCSITERRAEEAEREIIKFKLLKYLQNHTDKVMKGVITGVQEYGLFVQIDEYLLEGLVHIRNLTDDYYKLEKNRTSLVGTRLGKVYSFGDVVKIKITNIDLLKREIDFAIV